MQDLGQYKAAVDYATRGLQADVGHVGESGKYGYTLLARIYIEREAARRCAPRAESGDHRGDRQRLRDDAAGEARRRRVRKTVALAVTRAEEEAVNESLPVDDGRCFACGPYNAEGLHLRFAPTGEGVVRAEITLPPRFQGWRGVAHGGVVMMLLDEAMAHACGSIGLRGLTASMSLRFRAPVPLGVPVVAVGTVKWRRRNVVALEARVELARRHRARHRRRLVRQRRSRRRASVGRRRRSVRLMAKMKQLRAAAKGEREKAPEPAFDNRRARYEFEKLESLEAGIALTGTEIKSIRLGNVSINEAFARLRDGELWLMNFTIPTYKEGSFFNHEPGRPRKLLLHREQIQRLAGRAAEKGLTLVPWRLYFKNGRVKIELALVRGKKLWDRRRAIQARDVAREIARATTG